MGFEFRRNFQDWEVSEFQRLIDLLHRQVNPVDNPDALCWGLGSDGVFHVWSFYEKLLVRGEVEFPCKGIWASSVPRKVCFSLR